MAPKAEAKSKKTLNKEKERIVEDKTFGLKNKNKSKKVQSYVSQVNKQAQQTVDNRRKNASGSAAGASADAAAKSSKRAMLEARMAELSLVHRPVKEKAKVLSPEEEERRRVEAEEEAERIRIASLPVEDQIEEQRARLCTRTPVTLELFLRWQESKRTQRAKSDENRRREVLKASSTRQDLKKGGTLTGRELFELSADMFADDEHADDTVYERRYGDDDNDNDDGSGGERNHDEQRHRGERDGHTEEHDGEHGAEQSSQSDDDDHDDGEDADATVGDESLFS